MRPTSGGRTDEPRNQRTPARPAGLLGPAADGLESHRLSAGLLADLGSLTSIEVLDLNDTFATNADLEHLRGLTSLKALCLNDTDVTDAGLVNLKRLTRLESLDLSNTEITDAGLEHLQGLTGLKSLDPRNRQVIAEGWARLRKALPNCKIDVNF